MLAVGSLLRTPAAAAAGSAQPLHVTWADAGGFDVGRLPRYASVPANTRNDRLSEAFDNLPALDFRGSGAPRAALAADPVGTADIRVSVAALRHATAALRRRDDVACLASRVRTLRLCDDGRWQGEIAEDGDDDNTVRELLCADAVILCIGATPRKPCAGSLARLASAGIDVLDHDDAVCPAYFAEGGSGRFSLRGRRLAIVGPSHSGCLAARNALSADGGGARSVYLIGRHPDGIRFAEQREGWIKFDGTGLKGKVSEWAREWEQQAGGAASGLTALHYVDATAAGGNSHDGGDPEARAVDLVLELGVDAVVWTTGFDAQGTTAQVEVIGEGGARIDLLEAHDGRTGAFRGAPGMVGGGIGFPEVWTDPEGFSEPRVGFAKVFSAHLDRMIQHELPSLRVCSSV